MRALVRIRCTAAVALGVISVVMVLVIFSVRAAFVSTPETASSAEPSDVSATIAIGRIAKVHLGVLPPATRTSFRCRLANTTDSNHRILRVNQSCGCVRVEEIPDAIAANDTAMAVFSIDTSNRQGQIQQHAIITTDSKNPESTLYRVEISASVQSAWSDPPTLEAGEVTAGSRIFMRYNLRVLGYNDVKVVGVRSTSDHVDGRAVGAMTMVKRSDFRGDIEYVQSVDLCLNAALQLATVNAQVFADVEADGETLTIPTHVRFQVNGPITCEPNAIVWSLAGKSQMSGTVRLRHHGSPPRDGDRLMLHCSIEGVTARVDTGPDGDVLQIAYNAEPVENDAVVKGTVTGMIDSKIMFTLPMILISNGQRSAAIDNR